MSPPAEQLIRDYLNRVSVAARRKLHSDDRRVFLARVRDVIERQCGGPGLADSAEVRRVLSSLGEPETLVDLERARLLAARGEMGAGAGRPGLLLSRPRSRGLRRDSQRGGGQQADQAAATGAEPDGAAGGDADAGPPLTGEIQVPSRPITARWRPGEALQPRQPRPDQPRQGRLRRIPRANQEPAAQNGAAAVDAAAGSQSAGLAIFDGKRGTPERPVPAPRLGAPPGDQGGPGSQGRPAGFGGPGERGPDSQGSLGTKGRPAGFGGPGERGPDSQGGLGTEGRPAGFGGPGERGPRRPWGPPGSGNRRGPGDRRGPRQPGNQGGLGAAPSSQPGVAAWTIALAGAAVWRWRQHPLEGTAVALLILGGLIYPFPIWLLGFSFWLLGILAALTSKVWDPRDKWVGLAAPLALAIVGTGIAVGMGGSRRTVGGYVHEIGTAASWILRIGVLLGAVYLAWRAQRGPRRPTVPPWNRPHRI